MNIEGKSTFKILGIVVLLISATTFVSPIVAESVIIPIKLDYPILRHLMLNQLFDSEDHSTEILQDPSGCSTIFLSAPRLRERQKRLQITTHVRAKIGAGMLGRCASLFSWEGDAEFLTEPVIMPGARSLRLNIIATRLYNLQGQMISSGPLWDLADGQLQAFLRRYEIDLAPSIDELNKLIPYLLNQHTAQQIKKITNSLQLKAIEVLPDAIEVEIGLQIDRLPQPLPSEAALSVEEIQQLEAKWQMMDAMITNAVKHYAALTNQQKLHEALVEVLLDARYRLKDALAMPVSRSDDPVRHWFIDSWLRLGPVLRQVNLDNPGQEPMLIISLTTATNALDVLDQLGPAIGLDISADGLRRLGRMLIDQPGTDLLQYEDGVDQELRHLFQLPASAEPSGPPGAYFNIWPIRSAWAKNSAKRLNLWVPKKSELANYLPEVRDLLILNASNSVKEKRLDSALSELYEYLVLATAWQESCWRQYMVKERKVVPLRSNTGDSGLMQMNERVWRGFYDIQKLRWDIDYNARAGAEVLMQYLIKYALKRGEHNRSGGLDNLARATYSAYNGGPGQTSRYRNPKAKSAHKKIDALFWEKYRKVKQGKELQVAQCLGADPGSIAVIPKKQQPPSKNSTHEEIVLQPATSGKSVGKAWILAQDNNHYTLQLAVFSSTKAARKFTSDNHLQGVVAIMPLGGDRQGQFAVLNGIYKTRSDADRQKQRKKKLKPWVRQFKDIHLQLK